MFGLIIPSRPLLPFSIISPTQHAITIPTAPTFTHLVVFLLPGSILPANSAAAIYLSFTGVAGPFRLLGALTPEKQSAIFRVRSGGGGGREGGRRKQGNQEGGRGEDESIGGGMHEIATADGMHEVDMDADDDATAAEAAVGGSEPAAETEQVMLGIAIDAAESVAAQLADLRARASTSTAAVSDDRSNDVENGIGGAGSMALVTMADAPPSTKILAQRIIRNAFNFLASFAAADEGGGEVVPLKSFQDWWIRFERRIDVDPGFLERSGE